MVPTNTRKGRKAVLKLQKNLAGALTDLTYVLHGIGHRKLLGLHDESPADRTLGVFIEPQETPQIMFFNNWGLQGFGHIEQLQTRVLS